MLVTTSKGNLNLNLQIQSDLESSKSYLWYIGSKELNSTYSYVVCANTKENALKINPYPEHDFEVPETIICIGLANPQIKSGSVICASFNHLKMN